MHVLKLILVLQEQERRQVVQEAQQDCQADDSSCIPKARMMVSHIQLTLPSIIALLHVVLL